MVIGQKRRLPVPSIRILRLVRSAPQGELPRPLDGQAAIGQARLVDLVRDHTFHDFDIPLGNAVEFGKLDRLFARSHIEGDLGLVADAQAVGEIIVMRTQWRRSENSARFPHAHT
jgi:hypothetical protein